jgi:hypothetical protein
VRENGKQKTTTTTTTTTKTTTTNDQTIKQSKQSKSKQPAKKKKKKRDSVPLLTRNDTVLCLWQALAEEQRQVEEVWQLRLRHERIGDAWTSEDEEGMFI